jgi:hypothetical protein
MSNFKILSVYFVPGQNIVPSDLFYSEIFLTKHKF